LTIYRFKTDLIEEYIYNSFLCLFLLWHRGINQLFSTSDKIYQLLAHGQWFSSGTPASSTTKTGHHDIAEILLKVALNTKIKYRFN
jgi:hypothetical protein